MKAVCSCRPYSTRSKVAGALHKPNGITLNCHKPRPDEKAVFSLYFSAILTCWYPVFISKVEKYRAAAGVSQVLGKRYTSFTVISFSALYSTQHQIVPSFFRTKIIADDQGLFDFAITPCRRYFFITLFIFITLSFS